MAWRISPLSHRAPLLGCLALLGAFIPPAAAFGQNETSSPVEAVKPGEAADSAAPPTAPAATPITPLPPRIIVDQSSQLTFRNDELHIEAELTYEIRDAAVSSVKVEAPKDVVVDEESVLADDMEKFDIDKESGAVTVHFKSPRQGTVGVSLSGLRKLADTDFNEPDKVPLFAPAGVERETGRITIFAGAGFDVVVDERFRHGANPASVDALPLFAGTRAVSSWVYHRQPMALSVSLVRKPARATATTATQVNVRDGKIDVKTRVNFNVENVAVDMFRIAVAAEAAETVRIETSPDSKAPAIRRILRDGQPVGEYLILTAETERPIVGHFPLDVTYQLKSAGDAAEKPQTQVAIVRVDGYAVTDSEGEVKPVAIDHVEGEVSVHADRGLAVNVDAVSGEPTPIEVEELQSRAPNARLAYRLSAQPVVFNIAAIHVQSNQQAQAVVSRAAVELVVDDGEQMTWRWRGRIVTRERQKLSFELPSGSKILGAYLDSNATVVAKDDAQPTEEGWDRFAVNVVRSTRSEEPFLLTLQFTSPTPARAFASGGGELYLRLPRPRSGNESIPIHELRATVWVPRQYALLGRPDQPVSQMQSSDRPANEVFDEWIDGTNVARVDLPVDGHAYYFENLRGTEPLRVRWWQKMFYTKVLSGALIVVGLILCATSLRNRLTILALAALGFVLFAFENPDVAWAGFVAARFGLAGLAALWLIDAARGPRTKLASESQKQPAMGSAAAVTSVAPSTPAKQS